MTPPPRHSHLHPFCAALADKQRAQQSHEEAVMELAQVSGLQS